MTIRSFIVSRGLAKETNLNNYIVVNHTNTIELCM